MMKSNSRRYLITKVRKFKMKKSGNEKNPPCVLHIILDSKSVKMSVRPFPDHNSRVVSVIVMKYYGMIQLVWLRCPIVCEGQGHRGQNIAHFGLISQFPDDKLKCCFIYFN